MKTPEKNDTPEETKKAGKNAVILTEENAPALFEDTAEANEDDIEVIDVSESEDK